MQKLREGITTYCIQFVRYPQERLRESFVELCLLDVKPQLVLLKVAELVKKQNPSIIMYF